MFLFIILGTQYLNNVKELLEEETHETTPTQEIKESGKIDKQQLIKVIDIACKNNDDETVQQLCKYLYMIDKIDFGNNTTSITLIITCVVLFVVLVIIIITYITNRKINKVDETIEQQREILDRLYVYDEGEQLEEIETEKQKQQPTQQTKQQTKQRGQEEKDPREHEFRIV